MQYRVVFCRCECLWSSHLQLLGHFCIWNCARMGFRTFDAGCSSRTSNWSRSPNSQM